MQTRPLPRTGAVLLGILVLAATGLVRAQDPTCSCPPISGVLYGIDPGGTVEKFDFESGSSASVPAPGDDPSLRATGLAVATPVDAFWVNGQGLDDAQ